MIVRDYASAVTAPQQAFQQGLGDAQSDLDNASPTGSLTWQQAIAAIRTVSVPMGQLQQAIDATMNCASDADCATDIDLTTLTQQIAQMATYAQQLPVMIQAAKSLPEYRTDVVTANELNNWLSFMVAWGQSIFGTVSNLPADVAQYVSAQIAAMLKALGDATTSGVMSFLPAALLVLGVIWLAERTGTGRGAQQRYLPART